jgi:hypothetical protein
MRKDEKQDEEEDKVEEGKVGLMNRNSSSIIQLVRRLAMDVAFRRKFCTNPH